VVRHRALVWPVIELPSDAAEDYRVRVRLAGQHRVGSRSVRRRRVVVRQIKDLN
jgi:hypothetical protein